MDNSISLNKFISDTGYCSRREADNLITSGRVLLNDQPATLGNRYKPGDVVEVDGSIITPASKEKRVYLALNKPIGITTTTELHIKDNIISFVGYPKRIFPIGRLDKDSEGLILLTNDGDIINKILRADNHHEKEYIVRVNKPIDAAFVHQMSGGLPILGTRTLPCRVQPMGRQTFRIILTQGLNRQIRRMCEYLGYAVVGLQRVRIMNIRLDKLAVGKWRYLSEAELSILMENINASGKARNIGKPAAQNNKPIDQKHRATKPGAAPKDQQTKAPKGKNTQFVSKENKVPAGKKPAAAKSWKKDEPAHRTAKDRKGPPSRTEKQAPKKSTDNKDKKRSGSENSFKNYRKKGRR